LQVDETHARMAHTQLVDRMVANGLIMSARVAEVRAM
jgi:hypothetical protein